jgi:hypothetical protein
MVTTFKDTQVVDELGSTGAELIQVLDELLETLVHASASPSRFADQQDTNAQQDASWLWPLADVIVELDFALRHRLVLPAATVGARCDELTRLLAASPLTESDFAERYACERALFPALAALHARVLERCRQVASRCSLLISKEEQGEG